MGKILIVDDSPVARRMARHAMRKSGHEIVELESGEQALEYYRSEPVELVILDLQMPGLGGLETLKRLRELDPSVRVVIFTGDDEATTNEEARRLGAIGFMGKPELNKMAEAMSQMGSAHAGPTLAPPRRGESRKLRLEASGIKQVPAGSVIEVGPIVSALESGDVLCGTHGDQLVVGRYVGERGDVVELSVNGRLHPVRKGDLMGRVMRAKVDGQDIDPNQMSLVERAIGRLTRWGTRLSG